MNRKYLIIIIGIVVSLLIALLGFSLLNTNQSTVNLIVKDKLDRSQPIITYKDSIYYISTDGLLKKINNTTVTTVSSINTSYSPKISYNGENISYINPKTRELTVYKTESQGSKIAPLFQADRVAFTQWQDDNNIIYIQLNPSQTNYGEYFNTEDVRPNIQGTIIRANTLTKNKEVLGVLTLHDLLLTNPNYIIFTTSEANYLTKINKFDIPTKTISPITTLILSQTKILNNNNILIQSPEDNYPKLIQSSVLQEVKTPTEISLITGLNLDNLKSLFYIITKKDTNILSNIILVNNKTSEIQQLDDIITNPINITALSKQVVVFTEDGVYLVKNNRVTE